MLKRIAEARAAGELGALLAAIPYVQFLGLSASKDDRGVITTLKYGPHLVGNPSIPALHGGTLGALLESAAVFELLWASETAVLPKTITITVEYMRSAKPMDTHARGVITRQGRRVANVQVHAWQDDPDVMVASAHANFLIKREE